MSYWRTIVYLERLLVVAHIHTKAKWNSHSYAVLGQRERKLIVFTQSFASVNRKTGPSLQPSSRVVLSLYSRQTTFTRLSVALYLGYLTIILTLSGYTAPTRVKTTSLAGSKRGCMTKSTAARKRSVLTARWVIRMRCEALGSEHKTVVQMLVD